MYHYNFRKNNMMAVGYFFLNDMEKKLQVVLQAADKQNNKMTQGVILRIQDERENTS
jgi:hypothetical protein